MDTQSSVLGMPLTPALNISPTRRDAHVSQRCSMGGTSMPVTKTASRVLYLVKRVAEDTRLTAEEVATRLSEGLVHTHVCVVHPCTAGDNAGTFPLRLDNRPQNLADIMYCHKLPSAYDALYTRMRRQLLPHRHSLCGQYSQIRKQASDGLAKRTQNVRHDHSGQAMPHYHSSPESVSQ